MALTCAVLGVTLAEGASLSEAMAAIGAAGAPPEWELSWLEVVAAPPARRSAADAQRRRRGRAGAEELGEATEEEEDAQAGGRGRAGAEEEVGTVAEEEDEEAADVLAVCSCSAAALALHGEAPLLAAVAAAAGPLLAGAQLWLTAPCRVPLFAGGSAGQLEVGGGGGASDGGGGGVARGLEVMRRYGVATMAAALPPAAVAELLAAALGRIAAAERALAAARPELTAGATEFAFSDFSSRGGPRFDLIVPLDAPGAEGFAALAAAGPWRPLVDALLGPGASCQASLVYSRPGAPAQDWHTDGAHLGRDAGWDGAGGGPPYALCAFIPLIDLDAAVGFTQFWPGTHAYSGLLGFGPAAELLGASYDAILPAGSAVLYSYTTMHRGMPNVSRSTLRPLIQLLYAAPGYEERRNYGNERLMPLAADDDAPPPPLAAPLLGVPLPLPLVPALAAAAAVPLVPAAALL